MPGEPVHYRTRSIRDAYLLASWADGFCLPELRRPLVHQRRSVHLLAANASLRDGLATPDFVARIRRFDSPAVGVGGVICPIVRPCEPK